ncbi:hypothetical protein ACOMHN_014890 [Nucella lapillus]
MAAKGKGSKKANEKIDAYKKLFNDFDKDKNGSLTVVEFRELLKAGNCNMSDAEIAKTFVFFDGEKGDRKISFDEFVKGMDMIMSFLQQVVQLFSDLDKDGSGFLNRHELKTLLGRCGKEYTEDEVTQILQTADCNGDNQISLDEFINACC